LLGVPPEGEEPLGLGVGATGRSARELLAVVAIGRGDIEGRFVVCHPEFFKEVCPCLEECGEGARMSELWTNGGERPVEAVNDVEEPYVFAEVTEHQPCS